MKAVLVLGLVLAFSVLDSNPAPVEGPGRLDDLPNIEMFQPEKKQTVPIKAGEYREKKMYLYQYY